MSHSANTTYNIYITSMKKGVINMRESAIKKEEKYLRGDLVECDFSKKCRFCQIRSKTCFNHF